MDEKEIPLHQERQVRAKNEALKEVQKKNALLKADLSFCFGTPEGKRVLSHIKDLCGFGQSNIGGNPQVGMDIHTGTFYNAAREGVYLELRKLIPVDILKQIEYRRQEIEEII